jgi:Insertion element 4 transposase N-terminal/Transposase DDE domain
MARAGQVRSRGAHLADSVALGVLTSVFPRSAVAAAIDAAGAREQRSRVLTAELTAYYTLGCALWQQESHEEVWEQLTEGLAWLDDADAGEDYMPASSSISEAKERLGSEALRLLFGQAAGPLAGEGMAGAWWRGRRKAAVDGFVLDAPDSPGNRAVLGGPSNGAGPGPFPQARVVAAAECGTGSILGARAAGYAVSEIALFRDLVAAGTLAAGMIVIMDRNFLSYQDYAAVAAAGADSVWRASASFGLPVIEALADGSWISRLRPSRGSGGGPVRVRVAEYTIDDEHENPSEVFCLVTNLLDPAEASVEELAGLYADRWTSETVFRCIKTTQRGGAEVVLRSKKPDGVFQEIWAILAVYQGLRHLICQAARASGADPWRIPFARTLRAARRSAHGQAAFSP